MNKIYVFPSLFLVMLLFGFWIAWKKNVFIWIPHYLLRCCLNIWKRKKIKHVIFCIVDHFEPKWNNASLETERCRVDQWVSKYPDIIYKHTDAYGNHPRHTFFYPIEEYRKEHLVKLGNLCFSTLSEVEIHLHHEDDTAHNLKKTIVAFKDVLVKEHSLLSRNKNNGQIMFGFIHGNWALDNSRPDGKKCGVNGELTVLGETGCYADFTMPSAPDLTQTAKVNSIYYAIGNPKKAKSHNWGVDVGSQKKKNKKGLMLIQGPLALNWHSRKWNVFPRIENGEISGNGIPVSPRVKLWIRQAIALRSRLDCVFVKLHTHGAQENIIDHLLCHKGLDEIYLNLENFCKEKKYKLHYVSAREMYNIVKALEGGLSGDPEQYRDYILEKI